MDNFSGTDGIYLFFKKRLRSGYWSNSKTLTIKSWWCLITVSYKRILRSTYPKVVKSAVIIEEVIIVVVVIIIVIE